MFGEKEIRLEAYRISGFIMDLENYLIVVETEEDIEAMLTLSKNTYLD